MLVKKPAAARERPRSRPARSSFEVPRGQTTVSGFGLGGFSSEGLVAKAPPVNRRTVSVGTDCSGMDTPIMALRNLNVKLEHRFSCDVNKFARMSIEENFPPQRFYDDLKTRDMATTPQVDVYVAGFPCQPFSKAGLQQGFDDSRGRGTIFWHIREYIKHQSPRVFVLENVAGLVHINNGRYYQAIMESLDALGKYNIKAEVINTKDHGVPQNRGRIYFVGILRSFDDGSFTWPEPVQRPSIEVFLEPRKAKPSERDVPPTDCATAHSNVQSALEEIRTIGCNPFEEPFIVDIDSSPDRMKFFLDVTPCLTCARSRGHWVTNRGRRLTKDEMMRLQGMNPSEFKVVVPEAQLGKQIGNAMSVNVLERLLVRLLPASGLVRHGVLVDRWRAGVPIDVLAIRQPTLLKSMRVPTRGPEDREKLFASRKLKMKRLMVGKKKARRPLPSSKEPCRRAKLGGVALPLRRKPAVTAAAPRAGGAPRKRRIGQCGGAAAAAPKSRRRS